MKVGILLNFQNLQEVGILEVRIGILEVRIGILEVRIVIFRLL